MVRRTRTEIKNYFDKDIKNQGLSFPTLAEPRRIIYFFNEQIDEIFNDTISLIKDFKYSRYTPLLYLKEKEKKQISSFDMIEQQQKNIGGFMKGILVKRLESSFYAFKMTTSRFIESYERFIDMYKHGTVYISKKVDVYDLLDNDQEDKLLKLVEEEKAEKYLSESFTDEFLNKLSDDLKVLKQIQDLWKTVDTDPKLDEFTKILKTSKDLNKKKVVVFTESKETSDVVYNRLFKELNGKVMRYSSEGANYKDMKLSSENARLMIKENFDPTSKEKKDEIDVLITTDVLAEGINLHRSNVLINYDLPWNPTRVLQRVGRVNRVGTSFKDIYVYNCFPTSEANDQIHLEENIISKIQAFHNTLGEDAKYLSETEEVESHELFGTSLYKKLNDKSQLEDEEENEETELKYLNIIRKIRDESPILFEKIKKLPKKARTATLSKDINDSLISFFRKGALKKFIHSDIHGTKEEIDFMTAAKIFECKQEQVKKQIPKEFFKLLDTNKEFLENLYEAEEKTMQTRVGTGRANDTQILMVVKFLLKDTSTFIEDDEKFLQRLKKVLEMGLVPKKTAQATNKELKKVNLNDTMKVLGLLKMWLSKCVEYEDKLPKNIDNSKEIILSEYFYRS